MLNVSELVLLNPQELILQTSFQRKMLFDENGPEVWPHSDLSFFWVKGQIEMQLCVKWLNQVTQVT